MTSESESEETIFSSLIHLDQSIFYLINKMGVSSWGDLVFPWLRERDFWIPLYVAILAFVIWKKKLNTWKWALALIILIILCDGISSHILKQLIWRDRPFNDKTLHFTSRLVLDYKPANSGFPSSHAFNHFGVAFFFFKTFKRYTSVWIAALFFCWAFAIIYAQVYVGVHYPLDVICGGILGLIVAYAHYVVIKKYVFPADIHQDYIRS